MQRSLALVLSFVAACGGGGSNPDAPATADAPPTPDAPGSADARPDAGPPDAGPPDAPPVPDATPAPDATPLPDAVTACGADLCLNITPVDATVPPAGRLAVGWIDLLGGGPAEIAYDVPWPANQVTPVQMTSFATPSPAYQFDIGAIGGPCPGVLFSLALVVASTDPDGDGAISPAELQAQDGTAYGVLQAVVARTNIECPPDPPDFPEGFPPGVHVYTLEEPVMRLDGQLVEFQTCTPNTPGCDALNFPF
jgi:hypothetical protein